jgi:hypothetical protein
MPRPHVFPDPKDRSINDPCVLLNPAKVIGLYNQMSEDDARASAVTDTVKAWIHEEARQRGWASVEFSGSQCLLRSNIQLLSNGSVPTPAVLAESSFSRKYPTKP